MRKQSMNNFGDQKVDDNRNGPTSNEDNCQFEGKGDYEGPMILKWIDVSENLVFDKDENGYYCSNILLRNPSCADQITYFVKPTHPKLFEVFHSVGILLPGHQCKLMVKSTKPEGNFAQFSVEAGFIVFGTPVFFSEELHDEKNLKTLWKSFGTECFPYSAVETFFVHRLFAGNFQDQYSIFERALMGNTRIFSPSPNWNASKVNWNFGAIWFPTKNDDQVKRVVKYQLGHLLRNVMSFKADLESQNYTCRTIFVISTVICLISFVAIQSPFLFEKFGPNGVTLADPFESATGWGGWFRSFF